LGANTQILFFLGASTQILFFLSVLTLRNLSGE